MAKKSASSNSGKSKAENAKKESSSKTKAEDVKKESSQKTKAENVEKESSQKTKADDVKKGTSKNTKAEDVREGSPKAKSQNAKRESAEKATTESNQEQRIRFRSPAGKIIIIRLFVKNKHLTPLLARLSVDDWVSSDGNIYPTHNRIEPGYLYILPEGEAAATISLVVPEDLEESQSLKSNLRFPGSNEQPLPIETEITTAKKGALGYPLEKSITISLPLEKIPDEETRNDEKTSAAIFHLVSGLANLSALPSQWLFAEGLVMICMEGERFSKEKEGKQLLNKLGQTRFFKNLTLAFASGRLPQWISSSILSSSSLHAAMGGQFGQGRIVFIWLKWLLSLIDSDIEDEGQQTREFKLRPPNLEEAVSRYGSESQLWAGYLLLGLYKISPNLNGVIRRISENISVENDNNKKGTPKDVDDVLNESGTITR